MGVKEENFMRTRDTMESAIFDFYNACGPVDIDSKGFAEDVNEAVTAASDGVVFFEQWTE